MQKGPNDLEQKIEDLEKQKVYLQRQCKKAGVTIVCQEKTIGPADMCVLDHDGYIMLVDVKAVSLREKNGWKVNRAPSKEQNKLGVELIYVNLDTREVLDHAPRKGKYKKNNVVDIQTYMETHMPE